MRTPTLQKFAATLAVLLLVPAAAWADVNIRVDFDHITSPVTQMGWDSLLVSNRYPPASIPSPITPTNGDGSTMGYNGFVSGQRDRGLTGTSFPTGFQSLLRDFHFIVVPIQFRDLPAGTFDLTLYSGDWQFSGQTFLTVDILDSVGGTPQDTFDVTLPDLTATVANIDDVRVTSRLDLMAGQVLRISAVNPGSVANPVAGLELTSVSAAVPEPTSLAIWSLLSVVGFAAYARRDRSGGHTPGSH